MNKHFQEYEIFRKKILYNYSTNVERYKLIKKKKNLQKIDIIDFTTNKNYCKLVVKIKNLIQMKN